MKSVKQQLQELCSTSPMTADVIAQIKKLCADPVKDKQANLKKQVASLKAQLAPNQQPEVNNEKLLEDLFQLQLKRQQEIIQDGIAVTIGASEKTFPCLQVDPETLMFPAGTAIAPSMHIQHKGNLLGIVTTTSQQAGRLKVSIWTPKQSAQVFTKTATATGHNLKQSGISTPCKITGDTMTFYGKSFPAGTILKCSEGFVEVIGSYPDNSLYVHRIKVCAEPLPSAPIINRSGVDTSDMPKNYSMYLNRFAS